MQTTKLSLVDGTLDQVETPRHAYIIHTPGDPRRARNVTRLRRTLEAAGVTPVRVVDGVRPADHGPLYSAGEWGCYLSHVGVLRRIAEGADAGGAALVLEDDAVLDVRPDVLARALRTDGAWDLLHLGYHSNTVFRAWDRDLASQEVLRVRGVLYGLLCYAARPSGLLARVQLLEALPFVDPDQGGGVGIDGALCELAWRDPVLVRLAATRSLFRSLPGVRSGLRQTSVLSRGKDFTRSAARPLKRLFAPVA